MLPGGLPEVVRAPNHLGDFVLALPALAAVPAADVVLPRWISPLAALLSRTGTIIPLDRGAHGFRTAVHWLRARRYGTGALLPPSFSSALLFRLGGVRRVRGLPTDTRRLLLHDVVALERLQQHRVQLYLELVTGRASLTAVPPVLPVPDPLRALAQTLLPRGTAPAVAIFPGSNAPARRWPAERFAGVARELAARGVRVVVVGAPNEAALTKQVAGDVAADLGGRTELPVLAALLAECDILLTNDSGPMHLAAAVGTRVLVVSGPADTRQTGPCGSGHVYLQRLDLPCVPCVRNECPRHGAGTILPEAKQECLRLIEIPDVLAATERLLGN
jgi:heptosyltransferase II